MIGGRRSFFSAPTAGLGAILALSLLAACSRAMAPEPAPAQSAPVEDAPPPPLLGEAPAQAPRPADETGLLGGPPAPGAEGGAPASATIRFRRPDGVVVSTMETIPDAPAAPPASDIDRPRITGRITSAGAMTVRAVPLVTPAPPPITAAAPVVGEPAKAPASGDLAKAPETPFVRALPLAAPSDPALAKLQAAVAGENAAGAKLFVPDALAKGLPAEVQLRLPRDLFARLKAEAARLGLGSAAGAAEVTARLSGQGRAIEPSAPQTVRLSDGQDIVFKWRVSPEADAKPGPLKADADVALIGEGAARTLPVAALEHAPPPAAEAPPPSNGQMRAKWALAIILVLLAGLVLAGVWRAHKERQRAETERRQRERAAQAFEPPAQDSPAKEPADGDAR
jgi:hypothetical protein